VHWENRRSLGNVAKEWVVVENNNLHNGFGPNSFWGQMANSVSSDASLAMDLQSKGKTAEEITEAVKSSHLGPSWGDEYKVKPYAKAEAAAGAGLGYFYDANIDPSQFTINSGETLAFGGRISSQIGIQFGPYFSDIGGKERNTSLGLGLGIGNIEVLYGKNGIGLGLGFGPSWGWSGISKNIGSNKIDINGSSGTEEYKYKFNNNGNEK
jgi:filamentous hemagglutinin